MGYSVLASGKLFSARRRATEIFYQQRSSIQLDIFRTACGRVLRRRKHNSPVTQTPAVNVNARDCFDRTPLSWAAAEGYPKVVRLFLAQQDIIIEPKAELSLSPLSLALFAARAEVVGLLLEYNDKIHILRTIGVTSESTMARAGDQELFQLLLYRTKVDDDPSERPLPQSATEYGINDIVWLLQNQDAYTRGDDGCERAPELLVKDYQNQEAQMCRSLPPGDECDAEESRSTQAARRGWSMVLELHFRRCCTTSIRLIHVILNIMSVGNRRRV